MRPSIEILARSVGFDDLAPNGDASARDGTDATVTVTLTGERLLDYPRQDAAFDRAADGAAPVAAVAEFAPPDGHGCCWRPAALVRPGRDASSPPGGGDVVDLPARIDPSQVDLVDLLGLDHVVLPARDLAALRRAGVTSGDPAVAIVDVGDPARPELIGLRAADPRERASDGAILPTISQIPGMPPPLAPGSHCTDRRRETPERFVQTIRAFGPVFFHRPLLMPQAMPLGAASFAWNVVEPSHVRFILEAVAKRCDETTIVDLRPEAEITTPPGFLPAPSARGIRGRSRSGDRSILEFDGIAYDVRGSTTAAVETVVRALAPESARPRVAAAP